MLACSTASVRRRSSPALPARTSASALAASIVSDSRLWISFSVIPWPGGPTWKMSRPMARSTGSTAAKSSGVAPTMKRSVPAAASGDERPIAASTMRTPRAARATPIAREVAGAIVLQSTRIVPGRAPAATPSGPSAAASTSGPSGSTVMTMSARAATARGVGATVVPRSDSAASGLASWTVSGKPCLIRFPPIPRPIAPSPIRPIRRCTMSPSPMPTAVLRRRMLRAG